MTTEQLTAQQVYDIAARGIIAQGGPSIRDDGNCVYRGPNGTKCAAGHVIDDSEYVPEMDPPNGDLTVTRLVTHGLLPDRLTPHVALLSVLQSVHDAASGHGNDFMPTLIRRMRKVAADFSLSPAVLDEVQP